MGETAACVNESCPEFGIAKDTSTVPPAFRPLLCGACGQECERAEPADD